MTPEIPEGYVERLAEALDVPSVYLEFNDEESEALKRPIWDVMFVEKGQDVWICDWRLPLDGNFEGLVARAQKFDFMRNGGAKEYYNRLNQKKEHAQKARRKRLEDMGRDFAGYTRKLWKRYLFDEMGYTRSQFNKV